MDRTNHHGRHSFYGKNQLCTMHSYREDRIGRFGRIFKDGVEPLYTDPNVLNALGKVGGPMDSKKQIKLTKNVPLGMIYFGQFIDHDITFDTTSNFSSINNPTNIENVRTANLDMDCVFGGGPEDEPFLYSKDKKKGLLLLTGATNKNFGQTKALEKHDLPRNSQGTAIIGDPRNDENRIISQLQLGFIRFYNQVYTDIRNDYMDFYKNCNFGKSTTHKKKTDKDFYEEARKTAVWHYQWIVLKEFLPALCGQEIVHKILSEGRQYYKPKEAYIPVEFSVAAYRFGHSMIAQNMKVQKKGNVHNLFSGAFGRGFAPITKEDQVVDWDLFFDCSKTKFQRAETMDTKLASDLLDLPFIQEDNSLAARNLRRGQSFLLPSGESVAQAMGRPTKEYEKVKGHVQKLVKKHKIELKGDTPLWFYILAEAELIGRCDHDKSVPGEGLGPVGATIVAETIIGLLELDHASFLGSNRDWTPDLVKGKHDFTMCDLLTISERGVDL